MGAVTPVLELPANAVSPAGTLTNTTGSIRLSVGLASPLVPGSWQLIKQNTDTGDWYKIPGPKSILNVGDNGETVGELHFADLESGALYHVLQTRPDQDTVLADATVYLSAEAQVAPSMGAVSVTTLNASGAATFGSTLDVTGLLTINDGFDGSGSTGDFDFPSGNITWAGAAGKTINLTANTGAIDITAGAASTLQVATAGALTLDGFAGVVLKTNTATIMDFGATSATKATLAADKDLVCAAGTTAVDMSLGTGDTSTTTGAFTAALAANKNFAVSTSGTGTVIIDNAATWSVGATNGTTGTLGRTGQTLNLPGVVTCAGVLSPPTVADAAVQGGVPIVFRHTLTSGANGDHEIVVAPKVRVIDAHLVMKGDGTAGSVVTVKNNGTAITNALDVSAKADKDLVRFTSIDDAQHEIAAGGTLRISKASTGGDFPGAEVYVTTLHVA